MSRSLFWTIAARKACAAFIYGASVNGVFSWLGVSPVSGDVAANLARLLVVSGIVICAYIFADGERIP